MALSYTLIISLSFILSFLSVALILNISHRMAWYDGINERKIHTGNIPRLGGIGFAFSFMVCFFVVNIYFRGFNTAARFFSEVVAFAFILIGGIRDDFKPLAPRYKLILQIGAALCILVSGHVFERLFFIDGVDFLTFPAGKLLRYPLTFFWIVGMTNAINFIDGVDGLAGGVSLLAALSFGAIFVSRGISGTSPLLCVCLAAALLGFLVFNAPFPRAKIFMGDGGAYFLGFALALFPLMRNGIGYTIGDAAGAGAGAAEFSLPVLYTAAILLIPILDTTAAVWRRLRDGRRIDSPDRLHTHHKLMDLGLSARCIDAVLFSLQLCLSVLVYIAVKTSGYFSLVILFLAYAVGIGFFTVLHFLNRRRLKISAGTRNHRLKFSWGVRIAQPPEVQ
jgi:UDP-GlcNAc:undecaprenyl-phosphate GlcNAc-1-phosphate transferase